MQTPNSRFKYKLFVTRLVRIGDSCGCSRRCSLDVRESSLSHEIDHPIAPKFDGELFPTGVKIHGKTLVLKLIRDSR
jgi:hypothetical protein